MDDDPVKPSASRPREYMHRGDHALVSPRSPARVAAAPAPEAVGSYSHRALEARAHMTRAARAAASRPVTGPAAITSGLTWAPARGLVAQRAPLAPRDGFDWVKR